MLHFHYLWPSWLHFPPFLCQFIQYQPTKDTFGASDKQEFHLWKSVTQYQLLLFKAPKGSLFFCCSWLKGPTSGIKGQLIMNMAKIAPALLHINHHLEPSPSLVNVHHDHSQYIFPTLHIIYPSLASVGENHCLLAYPKSEIFSVAWEPHVVLCQTTCGSSKHSSPVWHLSHVLIKWARSLPTGACGWHMVPILKQPPPEGQVNWEVPWGSCFMPGQKEMELFWLVLVVNVALCKLQSEFHCVRYRPIVPWKY